MDSAFGVTHVEKARHRGPRFRKLSADATQRINDQQARRAAQGAKLGANARKVAEMPGKIANAKVSLNDIGRGVGTGTVKLGQGVGHALTVKPGLTGAVVLGGGAGALYHAGRKKKPAVVVAKSAFEIEHTVSKAIRFPGIDTARAAKLGLNKPKALPKAPTTTKATVGEGQQINTKK